MKHTFLVIALSLCAAPGLSTPEPTTWTRQIFLGFDETSFYVIQVSRDNARSYYDAYETAKLLRFDNQGTLVETRSMSTAHFWYPDADVDKPIRQEVISTTPFDVDVFLRSRKVSYAFPLTCRLDITQTRSGFLICKTLVTSTEFITAGGNGDGRGLRRPISQLNRLRGSAGEIFVSPGCFYVKVSSGITFGPDIPILHTDEIYSECFVIVPMNNGRD